MFFSPPLIIIMHPLHLHPPLPLPSLSESDDDVGGSPSSSHSLKKHFRFSPHSHQRPQALLLRERRGGVHTSTQMHTQIKLCTFKCWTHGCTDTQTHTQSIDVWRLWFSVIAEGPAGPLAERKSFDALKMFYVLRIFDYANVHFIKISCLMSESGMDFIACNKYWPVLCN